MSHKVLEAVKLKWEKISQSKENILYEIFIERFQEGFITVLKYWQTLPMTSCPLHVNFKVYT